MQKWEYLFLRCDELANDFVPRYINNDEIPNWKKNPSMYLYINQLGEEGWEIVGNAYNLPDTMYTIKRFVFKRPKLS